MRKNWRQKEREEKDRESGKVGVHPQGGKFSPLPIRIIAYCIPAIACCILPFPLRTYFTREYVKRTEELPGQDFVRRNREQRKRP